MQFGSPAFIATLITAFGLWTAPATALPLAPMATSEIGRQFASQRCVCLCIDGRPQTVCRQLADAQAGTYVCPRDFLCPKPTKNSAHHPTDVPLESPHPDAFGCRATLVQQTDGPSTPLPVKVCHVRPR